MSATREQVYGALQTALLRLVPTHVRSVERGYKAADDMQPPPYASIQIVAVGENIIQDKGTPPLRTLHPCLVVYIPKGGQLSTKAGPLVNPVLDAIETIGLAPDPVTGWCDLGGLVSHAWIEGEVVIDEATYESIIVAFVPLTVRLNSDSSVSGNRYTFDAGEVYMIPGTVQDKQPAPDLTPVRVGNLKGVTVEIEHSHAYPSSQLQSALNVAVVGTEYRVKASVGTFDARLMSQIVLGEPLATGASLIALRESHIVPSMGLALGATLLGMGPVALWKCDETGGTTLVDATGNGHDAALSGIYTLAQPAMPPTGEGASVLFSGVGLGNQGTVPDSPAFVITADWTLVAWSSMSFGYFNALISKDDGADGVGMYSRDGANIALFSRNGGAAAGLELAMPPGPALVASRLSSGTGSLWRNGIKLGETAIPYAGANAAPVELAQDTASGIGTDGSLAFVAMFDRALTDGEMLALWTASTTIPSGDVVISPPGGGTYTTDLGVLNPTTGLPFVRVAATPGPGQYMVTGNAYSFDPAAAGTTVLVSYRYSVTTGNTVAIVNRFKGLAPRFLIAMTGRYGDRSIALFLNACYSRRLALPTAVERFAIMDLEFSAIADGSGNVGTISFAG